jgi:hypothetical protein
MMRALADPLICPKSGLVRAVGIGEIDIVEEVEELSAELEKGFSDHA